MNLLTSVEARQIAEAVWGRGGTRADRTNTRGAFYFSCSSHGGFVIDARVLSAKERDALSNFVLFDSVTRYSDSAGRDYGLMTPYRKKRIRVPFDHTTETFDVILLEEDCAWSLAYVMTEIRRREDTVEPRASEIMTNAADTFWNWYDVANPAVMAWKFEHHCRENKDPNLIVSAVKTNTPGVTQVWTADGKTHFVTSYENARDRFGIAWLSNCQNRMANETDLIAC